MPSHLTDSFNAVQSNPLRFGELVLSVVNQTKDLLAGSETKATVTEHIQQALPKVKEIYGGIQSLLNEFGPGVIAIIIVAAIENESKSK